MHNNCSSLSTIKKMVSYFLVTFRPRNNIILYSLFQIMKINISSMFWSRLNHLNVFEKIIFLWMKEYKYFSVEIKYSSTFNWWVILFCMCINFILFSVKSTLDTTDSCFSFGQCLTCFQYPQKLSSSTKIVGPITILSISKGSMSSVEIISLIQKSLFQHKSFYIEYMCTLLCKSLLGSYYLVWFHHCCEVNNWKIFRKINK